MAHLVFLRLKTAMLLTIALWLGLLPLSSTRVVAPSPPAADGFSVYSTSTDPSLFLYTINTADNHQLKKRALNPASIEKGRRLDCLMSANIAHAQQINGGVRVETDIDEYAILATEEEGWELWTSREPKYMRTGLGNDGNSVLTALTGADPANTEYQYYLNARDAERSDNPDQETKVTYAHFSNGINTAGGVIIADANLSPKHSIPLNGLRDLTDENTSVIKQWSQATMGMWEGLASARDVPTTSLAFIIRSWIVNEDTQTQIFEALRNVGRNQVPTFQDRMTWHRTSTSQAELDGFYALLGSPNGAGSAFLLATHKMKLGIKRVSEITVFNGRLSAQDLYAGQEVYRIVMSFKLEVVTNPTTGTS